MSIDTSSPDALVWDVARQITDAIGKWYKEDQPKGEAKMTEEISKCRHYSIDRVPFCSVCCRETESERVSHLPCCVQPETHGPETPCDTVSTKYADESREDLARRVTVLEKYSDRDFKEREELLSEVKRWHVAGMYRKQSQSNCVDNECKNFGAPTLFLCDECMWPDAKMRAEVGSDVTLDAVARLEDEYKKEVETWKTAHRLLKEELRQTKEACRESIEIEKAATKGAGEREEAFYARHTKEMAETKERLAFLSVELAMAKADVEVAKKTADHWRNECQEALVFGEWRESRDLTREQGGRLRRKLNADRDSIAAQCDRQGVRMAGPANDPKEQGLRPTGKDDATAGATKCGSCRREGLMNDNYCAGCGRGHTRPVRVTDEQLQQLRNLGAVNEKNLGSPNDGESRRENATFVQNRCSHGMMGTCANCTPTCIHNKPLGYCAACGGADNRDTGGQGAGQNGWTGKAVL